MSRRGKLKHSVIVCHPSKDSFTSAVADRYCVAVRGSGHDVVLRDLYRMGFDPVLKDTERPSERNSALSDDISCELELLAGSDIFVLVYPIWFGMPPAMLKGYVDRVFGAGFSHRALRERATHPLLSGKTLLSFTSSGNSEQWLDEQGAFESLINVFDTYLRRAFSMAGAHRVHFSNIVENTKKAYVDECLFEVERQARQVAAPLVVAALR